MATSKYLKPRRGSTAEHSTFKGEAYEITFDTDKKTVVAHDGLTMGGFPLAHEATVTQVDSELRNLIDQKVSDLEGVSSSELAALETALRGLINLNAQQQTTRDNAQDDALTSLNSTLRALIASEVAKYLPLTGGTISGWLRFLDAGRIQWSDDGISFYAQSTELGNLGASITLYKYDAASNSGCITITPRLSDGNPGPIFKIYPDGRVTLDGQHFVRAVNGNKANAAGEVSITIPAAVSSVDGATGAVSTASEKGSNYIRFSNGLQLCWATVSIAQGSTTVTWTFSKAFSSAPRCTATVIGTAGEVNERNFGWYDNSTSSIKVKADSTYGTGLHCIAIGFWK